MFLSILIALVITVAVRIHPARARAAVKLIPTPAFVADALCVHAGWHYTATRPSPGAAPQYLLFHHGFWRTWKLPYGAGSNGEGAWSGVVGDLYGGGLSFTVGTWNRAAAMSRGLVPFESSTVGIAAQTPGVQIEAMWLIVAEDGDFHEWPQTSVACGLG